MKMKHKVVEINGIEIKIPCKYKNPRKQFTTKIDEELYNWLRDISNKTDKEISKCVDCLILEIKEDDSKLKSFLERLVDY